MIDAQDDNGSFVINEVLYTFKKSVRGTAFLGGMKIPQLAKFLLCSRFVKKKKIKGDPYQMSFMTC